MAAMRDDHEIRVSDDPRWHRVLARDVSADGALEKELKAEFPAARIRRDEGAIEARLKAVLDRLGGAGTDIDLPLDVRATAFQWRVWEALRAIPRGETRAYKEIAAQIGAPKAARAVGRACAANPVAVIVPCHRAVGASGRLTGYRWGLDRKKKLLARERTGRPKDGP